MAGGENLSETEILFLMNENESEVNESIVCEKTAYRKKTLQTTYYKCKIYNILNGQMFWCIPTLQKL